MGAAVVAGVVVTGSFAALAAAGAFVQLAGVGIAVGAVAGLAYALLTAEKVGVLRRYPGVLVLPVVALAYAAATLLGGSGLMAAFACGVLASNHRPPLPVGISSLTRRIAREYASPTSVAVRALLFVGLGANVRLGDLAGVAVPGLLVTLALMLVARPLTVLACAWPDRRARWTWRELLVFGWTRETGVVPGALAALLVSQHVPGAELVAAVTAIAIVVTVPVQGSTTPWLVRRLGLERLDPATR
jgi:cell volume regulation protein A